MDAKPITEHKAAAGPTKTQIPQSEKLLKLEYVCKNHNQASFSNSK